MKNLQTKSKEYDQFNLSWFFLIAHSWAPSISPPSSLYKPLKQGNLTTKYINNICLTLADITNQQTEENLSKNDDEMMSKLVLISNWIILGLIPSTFHFKWNLNQNLKKPSQHRSDESSSDNRYISFNISTFSEDLRRDGGRRMKNKRIRTIFTPEQLERMEDEFNK